MSVESDIFRKGSRTYFWSSIFFPRRIRDDVFRLYSFVRVADNYVDEQPAQPQKLLDLEEAWQRAIADHSFETKVLDSDSVDQRVLKNIVAVSRKYSFEPAWVEAFFAAMKSDIRPKSFTTLDDSLTYVYGSAEVVGLMMSQVMGLPKKAQHAAQYQGRAMQWVNFIRDVDEDNDLGRLYFPKEDLRHFGLKDLSKATTTKNPQKFTGFMQFQIKRYQDWQGYADRGLKFIPRRLRIPLLTAVRMYNWTAEEISKDPMVVFQRKVKPTKWRVLRAALGAMIHG